MNIDVVQLISILLGGGTVITIIAKAVIERYKENRQEKRDAETKREDQSKEDRIKLEDNYKEQIHAKDREIAWLREALAKERDLKIEKDVALAYCQADVKNLVVMLMQLDEANADLIREAFGKYLQT